MICTWEGDPCARDVSGMPTCRFHNLTVGDKLYACVALTVAQLTVNFLYTILVSLFLLLPNDLLCTV